MRVESPLGLFGAFGAFDLARSRPRQAVACSEAVTRAGRACQAAARFLQEAKANVRLVAFPCPDFSAGARNAQKTDSQTVGFREGHKWIGIVGRARVPYFQVIYPATGARLLASRAVRKCFVRREGPHPKRGWDLDECVLSETDTEDLHLGGVHFVPPGLRRPHRQGRDVSDGE